MQFPPDFRSRHHLERFKLSLKGGGGGGERVGTKKEETGGQTRPVENAIRYMRN